MDTFKDKQVLDDLHSRGNAPWEVWKSAAKADGQGASESEQQGAQNAAIGALTHHA
jgi:hypothetical protein